MALSPSRRPDCDVWRNSWIWFRSGLVKTVRVVASPMPALCFWRVSQRFYENAFGQQVAEDYGECIALLSFETEILDAVWVRLNANGVRVIHGIPEQPWSQRVFRVYDPDGHPIEIAEPLRVTVGRLQRQGLSIDEIAGAVSLDRARVEVLLQSDRNAGRE